jgi:hypothetical protein
MAITPVTTGMLSVDGFEADEVLPDIERQVQRRERAASLRLPAKCFERIALLLFGI